MPKITTGHDMVGKFAPEFARYNDDILFGEVWDREDKLAPKYRSMITISALMSAGNFEQLKHHFVLGKQNGITLEEAVEIVTQLAFYTGWPKAWSALMQVREVYDVGDDQ